MYTIVSVTPPGMFTVAVPPPLLSLANTGAGMAANGVVEASVAVCVYVNGGAFCAATNTLSVYGPATGAISTGVNPGEYPAKFVGNVPSLKNGTAGGPVMYSIGSVEKYGNGWMTSL